MLQRQGRNLVEHINRAELVAATELIGQCEEKADRRLTARDARVNAGQTRQATRDSEIESCFTPTEHAWRVLNTGVCGVSSSNVFCVLLVKDLV